MRIILLLQMCHYNHACYPGPDNSRLISTLNVHNLLTILTIVKSALTIRNREISVLPIVKIIVLP
jgi:hypothetical protein